MAVQCGYASFMIQVHIGALGMRHLVLKNNHVSLKYGVQVCIVHLGEWGAPSPMKQNDVTTAFDEVDDLVCSVRREPIQQHNHGLLRGPSDWQDFSQRLNNVLRTIRPKLLHLHAEPRREVCLLDNISGYAAVLFAFEEQE